MVDLIFFPVSWLSLTLSSEMCFQFARNGNWAEWIVLPAQKNTSAAGLQVDLRVIYRAMSACTSVCLCKCACAIIRVPSAAVFGLIQQSSGVFKNISCASAELKSASLDFTPSRDQQWWCPDRHSLHFFSGNTSWVQPSCFRFNSHNTESNSVPDDRHVAFASRSPEAGTTKTVTLTV